VLVELDGTGAVVTTPVMERLLEDVHAPSTANTPSAASNLATPLLRLIVSAR
jgi:hypothetical protein